MSKERLVEVMYNFFDQIDGEWTMTELANYILADGWIRPPCKVGQTLYFLYDRTFANRPDFTPRIYETNDWYFDIDEKGIRILTRRNRSYKGKFHYYLGETVFLTREEAEAKLKEQ